MRILACAFLSRDVRGERQHKRLLPGLGVFLVQRLVLAASSLAGWPRGGACSVGQGCRGLGASRKLFLFFLFLSLWLLISSGKKAILNGKGQGSKH